MSAFFILGVIVNYSFAVYFFKRARHRLSTWETAKGKIVSMAGHDDGDGESPVVEFSDGEGRQHEFTNFMGGSNWYRVGYRVDVLYDSTQPENAQINDWSSLWAVTAIGLGTGTLFTVCAYFAQ